MVPNRLLACLFLLAIPCIVANEGDGKDKEVKQWYDSTSVSAVKHLAAKDHHGHLGSSPSHATTAVNEVKKYARRASRAHHQTAKAGAGVLNKFEGWGHKKQLLEGWKLEHAAVAKSETAPESSAAHGTAKPGSKSTHPAAAKKRLQQKHAAESEDFSKTLSAAAKAANALILKRRLRRERAAAEWKAVTAVKAAPVAKDAKQTTSPHPVAAGKPPAASETQGGNADKNTAKSEAGGRRGDDSNTVAKVQAPRDEKVRAAERMKARKLITDVKRLLADAISSEATLHQAAAGGNAAGVESKQTRLKATLEAVEGIERMVSGLQAGIEKGTHHETVQDVEKALQGPAETEGEKKSHSKSAVRAHSADHDGVKGGKPVDESTSFWF